MTVELGVAVEKRGKDQMVVRVPYLPQWSEKAEKIGGRHVNGLWYFDGRSEEEVRELVRSEYGTDGSDNPELVDVYFVLEASRNQAAGVAGYGRMLCERRSRDSRVQLGEGVSLHQGKFPSSGGTIINPMLAHTGAVTLLVRDVPRGLAERYVATCGGRGDAIVPAVEPVKSGPIVRAVDDPRLTEAVYVVAASGKERQHLWTRWSKQAAAKGYGAGDVDWPGDAELAGWVPQVGVLELRDGDTHPVMMSVDFARIEGQLVLFYEPQGRFMDTAMMANWLAAHVPAYGERQASPSGFRYVIDYIRKKNGHVESTYVPTPPNAELQKYAEHLRDTHGAGDEIAAALDELVLRRGPDRTYTLPEIEAALNTMDPGFAAQFCHALQDVISGRR